MTETIHDTEGHGHLATFVGKKGRSVDAGLIKVVLLNSSSHEDTLEAVVSVSEHKPSH